MKNIDRFPEEMHERILAIALATPASDYRQALDECQKKIREDAAICSLSARCDQILMWAHYADQHKGICLRFRATAGDPQFGLAFPVEYSSSRPVVEIATKKLEVLAAQVLLTKADYWKYEEEWRLFDLDRGPGLRTFGSDVLDGIIFGAEASAADIQEVGEWAKAHGSPIELLKASLDDRQFLLRIEPLGYSPH